MTLFHVCTLISPRTWVNNAAACLVMNSELQTVRDLLRSSSVPGSPTTSERGAAERSRWLIDCASCHSVANNNCLQINHI